MNNLISDDELIRIELSKKKYQLFKNIDEFKIPYMVEDIFELGYNIYLKNLIKNDFVNATNNNTQTNSITESKFSTLKGGIGENLVFDILVDKFGCYQIENTSKIPHYGDIQITIPSGNKIIVEVKNYNKTIDQEQIDKLKFDMKFNNIRGSLLISLNSGIVGKKRFEIEFFKYDLQDYFIIYMPYSMHKALPNKKNIITHNSLEDSISNLSIRVEFGICICQNILDNFNKNISSNKFILDLDLNFITSEFNLLYEEFKSVKNSTIRLEENIKKSLDSHINSIKDFENIILKKINKFIKNKINSENLIKIKNIKLIKNENGINFNNIFLENWNIVIDELVYGMVVKINDDKFDFLLGYNNISIDKQFESFEELCRFIDSL